MTCYMGKLTFWNSEKFNILLAALKMVHLKSLKETDMY